MGCTFWKGFPKAMGASVCNDTSALFTDLGRLFTIASRMYYRKYDNHMIDWPCI
jgi:hypothetical protein